MKKLLIVSLFLLSMIGLMAQGSPHTAKFNLQTAAGGYHASDAIGFKACTKMPDVFGGAEQWTATTSMYWNWPGVANDAGLNSAPTQYYDVSDPDTPGRIVIQMSPFTTWGADFTGAGAIVTANFYFVDGEGNETGPYNLAKSDVASTTYPDVIAWGGPAGPVAPDWCTAVNPLAGATDVATSVDFEWANEDDTVLYDFYYRIVGALNWTNPVSDWNETSVNVPNLVYSTVYEWKVEPFLWAELPGGDKVYPEGEVPVWSFTTMGAPVVNPNWAVNATPVNEATDVALMPTLTWTYDGPAVDGYEVYLDGFYQDDVVGTLEYTIDEPLDYNTVYTWGVKPYILEADKGLKGMKAGRDEPGKLYPTEGTMPTTTFTTMAEPVVYPTWATYATPENEADSVAIDASLTWAYDGPAVDGYEVWVNGFEQGDVTEMEFVFPEDLNYNTEYTWGVVPFILVGPAPDKKVSKGRPAAVKRYPEGHNYGDAITTWSFTTENYEDESDEILGGIPVTVQLTVVFDNPTSSDVVINGPVSIPTIDDVLNALPGNHGGFLLGARISQSVAGTFTYTFIVPGGDYTGVVYLDGVQYFAGTWVGGIVTVVITFDGSRDDHEVVITEPTLPVELSSFTAAAHASEYVTLKWVTESESNLHGYNVYRSETENQDQAIRINPSVLAANNTTQTSTYTYTDSEVESTTYYYWLEVSELSNENTFHGPIVVTVEDDAVVPGVTETTFRNFGPSPFTDATSTTLRVKEGETASITIYNLLGQVVRRESFNAGEHNFTFNGRDLNNKKVANGIYFVKMTSPTASKSFKIVKIK